MQKKILLVVLFLGYFTLSFNSIQAGSLKKPSEQPSYPEQTTLDKDSESLAPSPATLTNDESTQQEQKQSQQEPAPFLSSEQTTSSYEHAFVKMIATLVGLLFLVFFTFWILRKLTHGKIGSLNFQKKIQILERRPISPKTVLFLIEIDHQRILISESQWEVNALTKLDQLPEEG